MRTLYLDCGMGAAGDMLSAALFELIEDREATLNELNAFGIPHVEYAAETVTKCGIRGTKMRVLIKGHEEGDHHHDHEHEHHHEHHHHEHSDMAGITAIIRAAKVSEAVKEKALAVYRLIAEAESEVHGTTVSEIHFHEVGTLDAIADILAFCYLLDKLRVDRVIASPVNVGKGTVKCAHGVLPVPAPATALLLRGIPIYSNEIESELCTPTGAALLKAFVDEFAALPEMTANAIGYGMGAKDFARANCLRAMLGESEERAVEISFNVDDMTAEEIAFGMDEIRSSGVKDVFAAPAAMKKNRLGTLVTVLCAPEDKEKVLSLIFRHFSTIGVRETLCRRYTMKRSVSTIETKFGTVRKKESEGYGYRKSKYEYDDLAKIAKETGRGIREILKELENGGAL